MGLYDCNTRRKYDDDIQSLIYNSHKDMIAINMICLMIFYNTMLFNTNPKLSIYFNKNDG